jgi:restriction system protein
MPIPDYQSLMLPVLVASAKSEVRIGSAVEELADQLGLNPQERSDLLPSGKQTVFSNRVHWAKSYLSKARLVELPRRGYFRITPGGQTVLHSQPAYIDNRFLMQFEEFRQFRERSNGADEQGTQAVVPSAEDQKQTPDEIMRTAHRQVESVLGQDLLDRVREAHPEFFERLIVSLLLSMAMVVPAPIKPVVFLAVPATMALTALLTRTPSVWIVSTSKPSDTRQETTSAPGQSATSSAASTATKPPRVYS